MGGRGIAPFGGAEEMVKDLKAKVLAGAGGAEGARGEGGMNPSELRAAPMKLSRDDLATCKLFSRFDQCVRGAVGRRKESAVFQQKIKIFRLIIANVPLLVFFSFIFSSIYPTEASGENLSCEWLLQDAYDRYRGLSVWDQFPKMGVTIGDPQRGFFMDGGIALAEKMWRFFNDINRDDKFEITQHYAIRINPIRNIDDLWGNKSFYVSMPKLIGTPPSAIPDEKK